MHLQGELQEEVPVISRMQLQGGLDCGESLDQNS